MPNGKNWNFNLELTLVPSRSFHLGSSALTNDKSRSWVCQTCTEAWSTLESFSSRAMSVQNMGNNHSSGWHGFAGKSSSVVAIILAQMSVCQKGFFHLGNWFKLYHQKSSHQHNLYLQGKLQGWRHWYRNTSPPCRLDPSRTLLHEKSRE